MGNFRAFFVHLFYDLCSFVGLIPFSNINEHNHIGMGSGQQMIKHPAIDWLVIFRTHRDC